MEDFFKRSTLSANDFLFKNKENGISLYLKREDLLHPEISGNKFRKLKYNLIEAKKQKKTKLLTFGGAFSNHISATAAAGREFGFETIGVIRGEELGKNLEKTLTGNPTLKFAVSCGMELHFISRKKYRHIGENIRNLQGQKKTLQESQKKTLQDLREKFGDFYLLPEGGTNELAIKGCEEILSEEDKKFDYVCCPVGTGGTLGGIVRASGKNQHVLGFSVLKGDFLTLETQKIVKKNNWEIITNFNFGGYGKVTDELVHFMNTFKKTHQIQLDPIYTGKMVYGIFHLMEAGFFKESTRIIAVHTGGLQGIAGMNNILKKKKMTTITG